LLLALSLGLGYALDTWLPPVPRWTRQGDFQIHGFVPDGRSFWTTSSEGIDDRIGPLHCWDVQSGQAILSALSGQSIRELHCSEDRRILAALTGADDQPTHELRCFELETGNMECVPIASTAKRWELSCSPHGTLIAVHEEREPDNEPADLLLFQTGPLRLLTTLPRWNGLWKWAADGASLRTYRRENDGTASLWQLGIKGNTKLRLDGAGWWHDITADGRFVTTTAPEERNAGWEDGRDSLLVWDLTAIGQPGYLPNRIEHLGERCRWALLSDSRHIVVAPFTTRDPATLAVWDLIDHR
jgi:hypothetical protein